MRRRLAKLGARAGNVSRRPTNMLFLDAERRILWDGTDALKEWAGRHISEWPEEWCGLKTYHGLDPLAVFDLKPGQGTDRGPEP